MGRGQILKGMISIFEVQYNHSGFEYRCPWITDFAQVEAVVEMCWWKPWTLRKKRAKIKLKKDAIVNTAEFNVNFQAFRYTTSTPPTPATFKFLSQSFV